LLYFLYHLVFQMGRETLVRSPATKDQLRWILPILLQIRITI